MSVTPGGMEMMDKPHLPGASLKRHLGEVARGTCGGQGCKAAPKGLALERLALLASSGGQQLVRRAEELVANAVQRCTRSRQAAHQRTQEWPWATEIEDRILQRCIAPE